MQKRVNTLVPKLCEESREAWASISGQEKKEWMAQHKDLAGQGLRKELEHWVSRTVTRKTTAAVGCEYDYFDEADVKEAYKKKPEQIEHILKNAKTVQHAVRGVTLYMVPRFTGREEEQMTVEDEAVSSAKACEKEKAVKRAAGPSQPKPSKLQKIAGRVQERMDSLSSVVEMASTAEMTDWVPKAMLHQAKLALAAGQEVAALLEMAQEPGCTADVAELHERATKALHNMSYREKAMDTVMALGPDKEDEKEDQDKDKKHRIKDKKRSVETAGPLKEQGEEVEEGDQAEGEDATAKPRRRISHK